ncbi:hypothetical protein E2H86_23925 [Pseudomonas putida]|uniref:hypothetical protein n=1 Tax=Pseudomonas putida TaxID=303 RepID=UPI00105925FA|nr:hypothetical protein [Pseudomonas putida]TDJ73323.1 hypothetical protein E2H86_23925 [Pseudomonas putida]
MKSINLLDREAAALVWLYLDLEYVNELWREAYTQKAQQIADTIYLDRLTDSHSRQVRSVAFGYPQLDFGAEVTRVSFLMLRDLKAHFTREIGAAGGYISEVSQTTPLDPPKLTITFRTLSSRLHYRTVARGEVSLEWAGGADYAYTGIDADMSLFKRYFESVERKFLYRVFPPLNPLMHDVYVFFGAKGFWLWNSLRANARGSAPNQRFGVKTRISENEDKLILYSIAYPEIISGGTPFDVHWVPQLVDPQKTLSFQGGIYWPDVFTYFGVYRNEPSSSVQRSQPPDLHLSPWVRTVGAGGQRSEIAIETAQSEVSWSLGGSGLGTLVHEGGKHFYVPPPTLCDMELIVLNKTRHAAIEWVGDRQPATVDTVSASVTGCTASTSFVSMYAPQTHYFKAILANNKVKLSLWYLAWDTNREVEVDTANIEWHVVAGNGTVSATGVFSPAINNPSPYSAVWARDLDNGGRLLYWALTIIPVPLYSPEKVVELFDE